MARSKEPRLVAEGETGGWIADSDDEEIDEDEAFNSDDELAYGGFFPSGKQGGHGKGSSQGKDSKGAKGVLDEESDGGDSEEGDDSVDGSDDDGSDEHEWAGSEDSDADDDGGQYMLDLLANLDKQPTLGSDTKPSKKTGGKIQLDTPAAEAAARMPETQFGAGALAALSADGGGKLTLDALMGGIADTADFASVQRSMRSLSGSSKPEGPAGGPAGKEARLETTAVPVSRVVSERASRKVHYQSTSKDVARWQDAVHEQRDAETLDFRTNRGGAKTHQVTRDKLVEKFEATTAFERELQSALEKAGMADEETLRKREHERLTGTEEGVDYGDEDDLGTNHISLAEYRKRHGELAKLRALMFYEEQKRHRINKIKSKKYRKIRKRQRERLKDAEDEAARLDDPGGEMEREKREKEEMDRMQERMTLAHKNTSKWARRVLRRGAKMDVEERRALSLQIAKGEELRRKAMGEEDAGSSGEESESEEGLLKKARDILLENVEGDEGEGGKKKGLFQLEFMKRGREAQRARAKEEARKLLEELEANDLPFDGDEDDDEEERVKEKPKKERAASEAETKRVLAEGELVASSLKFGKADRFAVRVDGNIELGGGEAKVEAAKDGGNEEGQGTKGTRKRKKRRGKKKGGGDAGVAEDSTPANNEDGGDEENPWIVSKGSKKASKPLARTVNVDEAASMLVDDVQDNGKGKRKREDSDTKLDGPESSSAKQGAAEPAAEKEEAGVAELSQAELVRRAFAAPTDLEAEEEFQKEKERMKERDDPARKKKEEKVVSGWGSWAGAGAPPPKKPRKLPPKLQPPQSKRASQTPKRKDDGLSTVIINEKRLKKVAKFQLLTVPYPYRSREEYERATAGNIGQEWNTINGTKEMSRPSVMVRAGKVIRPIAKRAKAKPRRAPAKF